MYQTTTEAFKTKLEISIICLENRNILYLRRLKKKKKKKAEDTLHQLKKETLQLVFVTTDKH